MDAEAQPSPPAPAAPLRVVPWIDPVVDRVGHDPRAPYVEQFWLGILGPSTTWLVRRLVVGFDDAPEGYVLDTETTARALGIGHRDGSSSPFRRSLARAERFGVARVTDEHLAVRRRLPPLSRRLVARLPSDLQVQHQAWQESELRGSGSDAVERARQLALNLLRLGEDDLATEVALHRRRIHPAVAADATRWARAELAGSGDVAS